MENLKIWIGGKWIDAESGKTFPIYNPANGEEFARASLGGQAEVDQAVQSARKAFPAWSKKSQVERSKIMFQIAEALIKHNRELADLETQDHGFPVMFSKGIMMGAAHSFEFVAQGAGLLMSDVIPVQDNFQNYLKREPIGVCALITSWNFPLSVVTQKLAFALAVGNTCVVI